MTCGNICYGIYYLMMFAIPLVVGDRFGVRAGFWLKVSAVSGAVVTLPLATGFNLLPIVDVANKWVFGAKVLGTSVVLNLIGVAIYWNGTRGKIVR